MIINLLEWHPSQDVWYDMKVKRAPVMYNQAHSSENSAQWYYYNVLQLILNLSASFTHLDTDLTHFHFMPHSFIGKEVEVSDWEDSCTVANNNQKRMPSLCHVQVNAFSVFNNLDNPHGRFGAFHSSSREFQLHPSLTVKDKVRRRSLDVLHWEL